MSREDGTNINFSFCRSETVGRSEGRVDLLLSNGDIKEDDDKEDDDKEDGDKQDGDKQDDE